MNKSEFLKPTSIVAIIRGVKPEEAVEVAQTMYEAGIRIIEVPLNSPDPFNSINKIVDALGDKMIVGAGTVITKEDVSKLKNAGGEIVVSPNMNPEVISYTKELGMLSYPGVMTVSECFAAIEAGADGLKVFPADVVGMGFIKASKVVLPKKLPMLAVGGVNEDNIQEWIKCGADGFGLGSSIYKPGMTLSEIQRKCKVILKSISAD
ncbi:MAG: 2-dehydro-3-deoxy-6-phosphogalactonate aldolase [Lentisphaeraceae bacterium]|nr:2-dehydro-3-deoxy-6-phosphogalactonate aldolase [Lentisphaeraceae bacterium]